MKLVTTISRTICALGLVAGLSVTAAHAQEEEQPEYRNAGEASVSYQGLSGLVEGVNLLIQNDMEGDCWTNASDVAESIIAILQENDIGVSNNREAFGHSPIRPRLELSLSGQRAGDACIASAQAALYFNNNTQLVFGFDGAIAAARTQQLNIMWMNNQALASNNSINDVALAWGEQMVTAVSDRITTQRESEEVQAALQTWGFAE